MKKNLRFLQVTTTLKKQLQHKNLLLMSAVFISSTLLAQNPLPLKKVIPGGSGRSIQKIVSTPSGKTFFNTIDDNNHFSSLWGLWTTDGTQAGTVKLSLNYPGYTTSEATSLTPLGTNKIIFAGDNEQGYGEIWASDGTQGGTVALQSFFPGGVGAGAPVISINVINNEAIYAVTSSSNHLQLRKTNGAVGDTALVYDFGLNTTNPNGLFAFKTIGNLLYFALNNGTTLHTEIWQTDGSQAGTQLLKDLGLNYGLASDFMPFGNNIYFITISSTFGDYIWKSDGTTGGTATLKQLSPTFNQDNLYPSYTTTSTALYFTANDGINGKELWKTDGTDAGTGIAAQTIAGSGSSNPTSLVTLDDNVYFAANTLLGNELVGYYNGTTLSVFKDIFPGTTGSNPASLTVQGNTILFSAAKSTFEGSELWITDGSTANTFEIANINTADNQSATPSLITATGAAAYFVGMVDMDNDGISDPVVYKYTVPQKTWTGNVNTDASNIDNWFPAGAPGQTDNVIIAAGAANALTNPFLFCNDLYNNGTIQVGSGLALISGNLFNAGVIDNSVNGVFAMVSSANSNRTFGSSGTYNGQLTFSSGTNVNLTASSFVPSVRVEGADTFRLGQYSLQTNIFTLQTPIVITDSTGRLIMPVSSSAVTFPVAADALSFTPVTITNSGQQDYFYVSVKNGVRSQGDTGNIISQQVVNKTWNIGEALQGGSNANITLQWNAADELPGFIRNNVYLNHYTSGAWDSGTPGIASGSGPYTFSRSGFTSFSPFSISSSTTVLPVSLISFTASRLSSVVQLTWQATLQKNIVMYVAERSIDGIAFTALGQVAATVSNVNTIGYAYKDLHPINGTGFYRLRIIDADGKISYSKIVAIKTGNSQLLQLFPNPAKDILNVQVSGINGSALLEIRDIAGRKIKTATITISESTSIAVDIHALQKGNYILLLKSNLINEQMKFVKE